VQHSQRSELCDPLLAGCLESFCVGLQLRDPLPAGCLDSSCVGLQLRDPLAAGCDLRLAGCYVLRLLSVLVPRSLPHQQCDIYLGGACVDENHAQAHAHTTHRHGNDDPRVLTLEKSDSAVGDIE